MTKLIETDVGDGGSAGVTKAAAPRFKINRGARVFTTPGGKKLTIAVGRDAKGKRRWAWNIKKSLTDLDDAIEKARGLLPKGGTKRAYGAMLNRTIRNNKRPDSWTKPARTGRLSRALDYLHRRRHRKPDMLQR